MRNAGKKKGGVTTPSIDCEVDWIVGITHGWDDNSDYLANHIVWLLVMGVSRPRSSISIIDVLNM